MNQRTESQRELTIPRGPSAVRAEAIPAREDETDIQVIHLPEGMLQEIDARATLLGRGIDWCLSTAWCVAAGDFESHGGIDAVDEDAILTGKMRPIRVELALLTWRHITQEAERLDRSKSWMLQRAWLIARGRLPAA